MPLALHFTPRTFNMLSAESVPHLNNWSCTAGPAAGNQVMTFEQLAERVKAEEERALAGSARWQLALMALPGKCCCVWPPAAAAVCCAHLASQRHCYTHLHSLSRARSSLFSPFASL